ncbi:hypothetical protein BH10CYA1_BH10CYA1_47430 [soil metagenome]
MDDQIDLNLQKQLNPKLSDVVGPTLTGDQRKSYPPGQVIDNRLRIIRELGRGGTGTVYQVEQVLLKRQYAMKILDPIQVSDEAWRRFQKEAQAAGLLDHPGFVKVHDFGLIDNQIPYFTMDLVTGDTLAERLRKQGTMSVASALPIFIQLCFALDYAHSKGVIHRDVKPSNISLATAGAPAEEQVKILDFGIAKLVGVDTTSLTQVGSVFGTPFYMSPEQCMGQPVDLRSDIYSLGCVFFEMLAGAPPFTNEHALTLMMQHQSDTPPSLKEVSMGGQFPAALEALIQKMLSKNPNHRYQRLIDTAHDLIDLQQGKAPSVTMAKKIGEISSSRRNSLSLALLAVVLAAITGTAFYLTQGKKQPEVNTVVSNVGVAAQPNIGAPAEHGVPAEATSSTDMSDVVTMIDRSKTADYSDVLSEEYFSSDLHVGGLSYRRFHFPKKSSIGTINYYDLQNRKHVEEAIGEITVPKFPKQPSMIGMTIDWVMCKTSPQLLKKFRPDEIGYLNFADDDFRKTVAVDSIFDDTLSFVDGLKNIYAVDLPQCATDKCLEHVAKLSHLWFLTANRTKISGNELKKLPTLQQLKSLRISLLKDASVVLPKIKQSKSLMSLKAVADDLQDSDLKNLVNLPALQELVLRENPKITDLGLTYLVGLPSLKQILLDGCSITPKAIKTLSDMKVRESISLDVSKWSKADVAALLKAVPCAVVTWNKAEQKVQPIRIDTFDSRPANDIAGPVLRMHTIEHGE